MCCRFSRPFKCYSLFVWLFSYFVSLWLLFRLYFLSVGILRSRSLNRSPSQRLLMVKLNHFDNLFEFIALVYMISIEQRMGVNAEFAIVGELCGIVLWKCLCVEFGPLSRTISIVILAKFHLCLVKIDYFCYFLLFTLFLAAFRWFFSLQRWPIYFWLGETNQKALKMKNTKPFMG